MEKEISVGVEYGISLAIENDVLVRLGCYRVTNETEITLYGPQLERSSLHL